MNIDVIDNSDNKVGNGINALLKYYKVKSTVINLHAMSNGVTEMVSLIERRTVQSTLKVLRIWGHGTPGAQDVSGDSRQAFNFSGISLANVNLQKDTLELLNPLFTTDARVELRGCEVGANDEGIALLTVLADIWKVNVVAGRILQSAGTNKNLWSPPVTTVMPNGALLMNEGTPLE